MSDQVYQKLAKVLDTLPNGFPATPDGTELKILKKIFTPDEAEMCCDMKMTFETAQQIAKRSGRPSTGLEDKLTAMCQRGEVAGKTVKGVKQFRIMPWVVGIYEFQLKRMDREFCELCEEYTMYFGPQLVEHKPDLMQVIPIEDKIPVKHQAFTYQQVSSIIDKGLLFRVNECICKKEQGMLGKPCKKPVEVCLAVMTEPDTIPIVDWGKTISKEEAFALLRKAEDEGLVHLTSNIESGHWFICNCCGCCCGILRAVNLLGTGSIINSSYYAEIDPALCISCGTCGEDRCQVHAIEAGEDTYRVLTERCIGCGLCASVCPVDAIKLVRKPDAEIIRPPHDEVAWNDERALARGVDYSPYK
jgi:Na+-translocating ferredoxin:NAD+ oxidoreductase subunit B